MVEEQSKKRTKEWKESRGPEDDEESNQNEIGIRDIFLKKQKDRDGSSSRNEFVRRGDESRNSLRRKHCSVYRSTANNWCGQFIPG